MAYKCLSLCRFRGFTAGFCKNFVQRFQKFKMRFQGKAENLTCSGCVRSFGFKSNVISQLFRIRNMSAYAALP